MSMGDFLSAIEDYLELKRAAKYGTDGDCSDASYLDELNNIKKRIALSFNELVDFRLDGVLEHREKRASSTQKMMTVPDPNMVWADVVGMVDVLNTAPAPIDPSVIDDDKLQLWFEAYRKWFNVKRASIKPPKSND